MDQYILGRYRCTNESECDLVKYFKIRLIYFISQGRVKIRPESEISSHTALPECNKWFIPL